MFLEDARPANDRALEVPTEMRLSLLRWDYPDKSGQGQPGATAAAATATGMTSNSTNTSAACSSTSLASREDGGRALPGCGGDEPEGADAAGAPPDDDQ